MFLREKRRDQLVLSLTGPKGDVFLRFPLTEAQAAILAADAFMRRHIKRHCPEFPCHLLACEGKFQTLSVYAEDAFVGTDLARVGPDADLKVILTALLEALDWLKDVPLPTALPHRSRLWREKQDWMASFPSRLRELARDVAPALEPGLGHALHKFIDRRLAAMPGPQRICIVHNDLDAGNIIVANPAGKTVLTGIIDFERFVFGDPLKDVSRLVWLLRRNAGLGDWLWAEYRRLFGLSNDSLVSLELYWLFDMLNQIRNEQFLITDKKWRGYIAENKAIIADMVNGDLELW